MFGCSFEFAEYHKSIINGLEDGGLKFIGLVDGRIRRSSRVGTERGDAWKKIIKYDINGDFIQIICSFIEESDKPNEVFSAALKKSIKYREPSLIRGLRRSEPMIKKLATACRRNGRLDASFDADYMASPPSCLSLRVGRNSQKGTRTGESSPGGLQPRRNVRRTDAEIFREGTIQIPNF
jgi:hypothetical protein